MSLSHLAVKVWYGLKDLFTLHKLGDKVSLTVKTDDVISDAREVDPLEQYVTGVSGVRGRKNN